MSSRSSRLSVLLMLGVTAVWGLTFVAVKQALALYPPMAFLAARFLLAAVLLAVFALRRPRAAPMGVLIGGVQAAAYVAQTYGLLTVAPSTAGLLTGLFVVFTPLWDAVLFRVRTPAVTWLAVVAALGGMAMLTYGGSTDRGALFGDGLVLLCAIAVAGHISLLSRYSRHHSTAGLAGWQVITCAGLFLLGAGGTGQLSAPPAGVLPALVLTGVLASALAFFAQTYVQRHLSASRAALLFTAEPAFALFFGITLAHDPFTPLRVGGAAIILTTLLFHETLVTRGAAARVDSRE